MKHNLSFLKDRNFPISVILFTLAILLVSLPTYFDANLTEIFGFYKMDGHQLHIWTWVTAVFEHGLYFKVVSSNHWYLLVHMGINLSILWIFGRRLEKNYGSNLFVIDSLCAYVAYFVVTFAFSYGLTKYGCVGASGIVFSYIPFGIVCYLKEERSKAKNFAVVIYLLLLYAGISIISGYLTVIYHLVSTGVGCLVLFISTRAGVEPKRSWPVLIQILPIILILGLLLVYMLGGIKIEYEWV